MGTPVFTIVVIDRRATGGYGEQDLTHRFDAAASHLVGNAFDRIATFEVVFTLKPTDDYHIDSFGEVHAGWRDPDTLAWSLDHPLYAGFITEHEGSFEPPLHIFTCTVSNYNILFDRTEVGAGGQPGSWPVPITDPPAGYPPGYTVLDWLIGTTPYAGIIPAHFQHVSNGGVDLVYDTIILDETAIPAQGMSTLFGYFGFMSIRALIDAVMDVARKKALRDGIDVKPTYFWRPVPSGTTLIPQFCCIDLNNEDTGVVRASLTTTPTGAERPVEYPYRHRRNAQPARTRVTVKGVDFDPVAGALNYFSYLKPAGDDLYPTYYQITPGWSAAPINESTLNTIAGCTQYATDLGDAGWGPEGTITLPSSYPVQAGDRLALTIPADGMAGDIFPVLTVEGSLIPNVLQLTLGHRPRDLSDILVPRPDAPMPQTDAGGGGGGGLNSSAAGIGRTGAGVAGAPRTRPTVTTPVHTDQNVVMALNNAVTGFIVQQNPADAPAVGETPVVPDAVDIHIMARLWDAITPEWVKTCWVDRYGTPHKQKLAFVWTADGTVPFAVAERMTIRTAQVPTDPAQAGVTFSISINDAGTETVVATITSGVLSAPFEVVPGNQLEVTATTTAGLTSLTLVSGDPL